MHMKDMQLSTSKLQWLCRRRNVGGARACNGNTSRGGRHEMDELHIMRSAQKDPMTTMVPCCNSVHNPLVWGYLAFSQ